MDVIKTELVNLRRQQNEISTSEVYRRRHDNLEHEPKVESSYRFDNFGCGPKIISNTSFFSTAVLEDPISKTFRHIVMNTMESQPLGTSNRIREHLPVTSIFWWGEV